MVANGQWDLSDLAAIPGGTKNGGTAYIRKDLLPAVMGLQAAFFNRFNKPLRPFSPHDAYRPYAVQVRIFLQRYTPAATGYGPFNDVRWWNYKRYVRVTGASAAVPGTSNHGDAEAIDWADIGPQEWDWLMAYAPQFGWRNPVWAWDDNPSNGSKEPWHWEGRVVPVSDYKQYLQDHGIVVPDTNLPDPLEEDMPLNSTDLAEIRKIIREEVWDKEYDDPAVPGSRATMGTMVRWTRNNTFDLPNKILRLFKITDVNDQPASIETVLRHIRNALLPPKSP